MKAIRDYDFSDRYYCPQCGREKAYQERVYDREKPRDWNDRNKVIETWDYCDIQGWLAESGNAPVLKTGDT